MLKGNSAVVSACSGPDRSTPGEICESVEFTEKPRARRGSSTSSFSKLGCLWMISPYESSSSSSTADETSADASEDILEIGLPALPGRFPACAFDPCFSDPALLHPRSPNREVELLLLLYDDVRSLMLDEESKRSARMLKPL